MLSPALLERTSVAEQMFLIRYLEERLQALCLEGLAVDLHFSTGQEAISVGVISMLRPTDYVVAHHRTIAHAVAKGVPLEPLLAEILGKASGLNGGLAGEMHLSHVPSRFMFSFQLVGTCVPVAAGIAWAVKHHQKTDDIVALFHGDAATSNGQWHEGLNIAAVQGVPLLLVCENNELAGNVRPVDYLPVASVAERAKGYGIEAATVDGNDIYSVQAAAAQAVRHVRTHRRPFLLECKTTRLGRHKQGQGDLRTKEEMQALWAKDPLKLVAVDDTRRQELSARAEAILASVIASPDAMWPIRSV